MRRLLRWAIWSAAAFLVVVLVGVVAARIFLSPDEVIKIAEAEGRRLLGREVSIGRLRLGLFRVQASGIVIGGEGEQGEEGEAKNGKPFVRIRDVDVFLNPSTLMYRRISIMQLTVRGVSARVRGHADGGFNFQDIIEHWSRQKKKAILARAAKHLPPLPASAEAAQADAQGVAPWFDWTIHELDLYDVRGEFRSDAGGASCSFSHIEVDKIRPGEPWDVFFDGACQKPGARQQMQLRGDLHIDTEKRNYRASLEIPLLDFSLIESLAPQAEGYRLREGIFAGSLRVAHAAGGPTFWDVDWKGKSIQADFRADPRGEWRRWALPEFGLKTKGRYDSSGSSARIESFLLETPFAAAKLTKPARWNVSAKDEVHAEVRVDDAGEAGRWLSRIAGVPPPEFGKKTMARMALSMKRDRRRTPDDVRIEVTSHLDPADLVLPGGFLPLADNVSRVRGNIGGKARAVFVSGKRVWWDVDLKAREVGASVRLEEDGRWEVVRFGESAFRSRGTFDLQSGSARINTLEIALPFARAGLKKPASWNVSGADEAALSVEVNDLPFVADFLERLGVASLGDVSGDAKIRLDAAVSRNRKTPLAFHVDARARFDSLPVAPLVGLALLPDRIRKPEGRLGGELQVSLRADGVVRWRANLATGRIGAQARTDPGEEWRDVHLDSFGLQAHGAYLLPDGSWEIEAFDLRLPFARAYLHRPAFWNKGGRDAFRGTLAVTDLGAAEAWLGSLMAHSAGWGSKGGKLTVLVSAERDRRDGAGFSWEASALFDPLHLAPLSKFTGLPPVLRTLRGEVTGKAEFAYLPEKKMRWHLDLASHNLDAQFLALITGRWRPLRTGNVRVQAAGAYDYENESARLRRFAVSLPFGRIEMPRPAHWNKSGMGAGRFRWDISNLEAAAPFLGGVLGEPVSELSLAGRASGRVAVSGSGGKTPGVSTRWSVAAHLESVGHARYPNWNMAGSVSAQVGDGVLKLRAPEWRVNDSSRPGAKPDVILQGLRASLDWASLLQGEIRSPSIRMKTLKIRYLRGAERKSNFASLFWRGEERKRGSPQAVGRKPEKEGPREALPAPPLYVAPKPGPGAPPGSGGEANGPLPAIRIAELEIERMGFHFEDVIAQDAPPVVLRVSDARLLVMDFDTRMAPNLRKTRLTLRTPGEVPDIFAKATLNPGRLPPDAEGFFHLSRFDLRKISPYARDIQGNDVSALLIRGTRITRGNLNFRSTYSLRDKHLTWKGRAQIVGLRLKPDEKAPLAGLAVELLRTSVLRLLKRRNDTIALDVRVSGRVDDPRFHFLDALVEPMFAGLFERLGKLGGDVQNVVKEVLGRVVEGAQKVVPGTGSGGAPPREGAREPPGSGKKQIEKLGKELEDILKKGFGVLFGGRGSK